MFYYSKPEPYKARVIFYKYDGLQYPNRPLQLRSNKSSGLPNQLRLSKFLKLFFK
jgi:hypothetical protein